MFLKISQNSRASERLSFFVKKLLTERLQLYWKKIPVQDISCELCEIPKNISFRENHRTTASGNDPGESVVFWGKSLPITSFLTRGRLYFNSSYIFAKSSTKSHTIRLLFGGISHISKMTPYRTWTRWNKYFQDSRRRGVVVISTLQPHSTVPELMFWQVQNLLLACRRFTMVRISDNRHGWK